MGETSSSSFTKWNAFLPRRVYTKRKILAHNHPSGRSFSFYSNHRFITKNDRRKKFDTHLGSQEYGDNHKRFFDSFLPKRLTPFVVPGLTVIFFIGMALVLT
jgi:hypothetical protein